MNYGYLAFFKSRLEQLVIVFEHYSIVNPVPLSRICSLILSNHTGHVPHLVLIKVGSIIKAIVYFCPVHTFINETFCPNDNCKGMLHLSHSMLNDFYFQLYDVFFQLCSLCLSML